MNTLTDFSFIVIAASPDEGDDYQDFYNKSLGMFIMGQIPKLIGAVLLLGSFVFYKSEFMNYQ